MRPEDDEVREMLRRALPGVQRDENIDLWPRMLRRLDERGTPMGWLDRILLVLVPLGLLMFPAIIPQLLYQL